MTAGLTPEHLFTHDLIVHHFEADDYGGLATPVPATSEVTGRFWEEHKIVRTAGGIEQASTAAAWLPGDTTVGPNDQIEYVANGDTRSILTITAPRFAGDTPAYIEVRLT